MRKLSRLVLLLVAAAATLGVSASTPVDACAQQVCPSSCGKGNYLCDKPSCGYIWLVSEH